LVEVYVNRWTLPALLLAASLLGGCGPGRAPPSQSPEPAYPGSGDLDADGTPDVRDKCPRDAGSPDNSGCQRPEVDPDNPD
jgi:hypothetical protein